MTGDIGRTPSLPLNEASPVRLNLPEAGTFLVVEYHVKETSRKRRGERRHRGSDGIDDDTKLQGKVREHTYAVDRTLISRQSV